MGQGLELTAQTCDGAVFPVEVSLNATGLTSGHRVAATVRNVTARRAAKAALAAVHEELKAKEASLRGLVANVPGAIYQADSFGLNGSFQFVSNAIET